MIRRGIVVAAVALGGLALALGSRRSAVVSADDLASRRLGQDRLALQPSPATGGVEDSSFFETLFDAPVPVASDPAPATSDAGSEPAFSGAFDPLDVGL